MTGRRFSNFSPGIKRSTNSDKGCTSTSKTYTKKR